MHRKKRINAFFPLYNRYRRYGFSIVYHQLNKCGLVNALDDDKESIVFEATNEAIKSFDELKGCYKTLFANIVAHMTLRCVNQFLRDPLSDYISLDDDIKLNDEMVFMDSAFINASIDKSNLHVNELEIIKKYYKGHYQRRIQRMIEMKRDGFSYKEIGIRYQMSPKAVRAIFYRLKIRIDNEQSKK